MKKIILILALIALAFEPLAFSSIGIKNDDVHQGTATHIDDEQSTDAIQVEFDGYDTATVKSGGAGDLTFQTTLIAAGRKGGASTASSSSTNIDPSSFSYTVLLKHVGGGGGLDGIGTGTELQDGTKGQVIHLQVVGLESGGTWIVTPDTSTGFTSLTFDAVDESATLFFADSTTGWILIGYDDVTIVKDDSVWGFGGS